MAAGGVGYWGAGLWNLEWWNDEYWAEAGAAAGVIPFIHQHARAGIHHTDRATVALFHTQTQLARITTTQVQTQLAIVSIHRVDDATVAVFHTQEEYARLVTTQTGTVKLPVL